MGYSPWGHKGSDTTEQLTLLLLFFICKINSQWEFVFFFPIYFLLVGG